MPRQPILEDDRARIQSLDYINVSHWVYHTYVQEIYNYKGIQRKKLHFGTGTDLNIHYKLTTKTHPEK